MNFLARMKNYGRKFCREIMAKISRNTRIDPWGWSWIQTVKTYVRPSVLIMSWVCSPLGVIAPKTLFSSHREKLSLGQSPLGPGRPEHIQGANSNGQNGLRVKKMNALTLFLLNNYLLFRRKRVLCKLGHSAQVAQWIAELFRTCFTCEWKSRLSLESYNSHMTVRDVAKEPSAEILAADWSSRLQSWIQCYNFLKYALECVVA
jgi:hypothetical protein